MECDDCQVSFHYIKETSSGQVIKHLPTEYSCNAKDNLDSISISLERNGPEKRKYTDSKNVTIQTKRIKLPKKTNEISPSDSFSFDYKLK